MIKGQILHLLVVAKLISYLHPDLYGELEALLTERDTALIDSRMVLRNFLFDSRFPQLLVLTLLDAVVVMFGFDPENLIFIFILRLTNSFF